MSKPDEAKAQKLVSVMFVNSIPFNGEAMSAAVGSNNSNGVDAIIVARLDADGTAVAIDKGQRADGLLLRRRVHDRVKNAFVTAQTFVPWANVRGVSYGE